MNIISAFFRSSYEKLIVEYITTAPSRKTAIKKELNDKFNIFYLKDVRKVDGSYNIMLRSTYKSMFYEYINGKLIFKGERSNVNSKKNG